MQHLSIRRAKNFRPNHLSVRKASYSTPSTLNKSPSARDSQRGSRTLAVSRANSGSAADAIGVGSSAWFGWARHCASLADHLVRQDQNGRRKREPQGCRGLEVDDEMEPHDLLDRQVGGLGPFENLVHEFRRPAM